MKLRLGAVALGAVCHITFACCVVAMFFAIHSGLDLGVSRLTGWHAVLANVILIAQFPILHSFLLTNRGQTLLRFLGGPYKSDLNTTFYSLIASLQLLVTFLCWTPSGLILQKPEGIGLGAAEGSYLLSWVYLGLSMQEAGLALQTGALGWWAAAHGRRPVFPRFPEKGAFRICRQPIYLAFSLILWTAPIWSADGIVLACFWTAYCILGPRFKEARCLRYYGREFEQYQERTPYFVPHFTTALRSHESPPSR